MNLLKKIIKLLIPPLFSKYFIKLIIWKLKIFNYGYMQKKKFAKKIKLKKSNINRIALINSAVNLFYKNKNTCKYLEIGCADDKTFNCIPLDLKNKVGVDPLSGGTIRQTSDEFFKNNKDYFDVIFIDGLHTYDQCLRDVENSLNFLNKGGFIFCHDFLPTDWKSANREQLQSKWNGDVWKVSLHLVKTSGIDYFIANCDQGVGIIKKIDTHINLEKNIENINNFNFKNYYEFYQNLPIEDPYKCIERIIL